MQAPATAPSLYTRSSSPPGARDAAAGKFSSDDRVDLAVVSDAIAVFINDAPPTRRAGLERASHSSCAAMRPSTS
jgi:hypothetical protein